MQVAKFFKITELQNAMILGIYDELIAGIKLVSSRILEFFSCSIVFILL